ncbi:MAG: YIP1 family protein [Myxococcota bacterium]
MTSISFPTAPPSNAPPSDFYQTNYGPPAGGVPTNTNPSANGPRPDASYYLAPSSQATTSFEDEPPLLEELGINVPAVIAKAKLVANPFSRIDSTFADEADMTGPLLLCLLLGFLLLLQRKNQFSVIYSQATVGCISVYIVFNLMSHNGIDLYRSTSILGYALLPMVLLSFFAAFLPVKSIRLLGALLGGGCIAWSSTTAAKIFVAVLQMDQQFWLVWYPLALLYASFAIITVF